jgi:hypothetical protein
MGILDMEERTCCRVVILGRSRWWLDPIQPQRARQLASEHVRMIEARVWGSNILYSVRPGSFLGSIVISYDI